MTDDFSTKASNKNKKNITIADVAKAAGVSLGTVSRVINNRDGAIKVSERTTKRVLEAAKELGYIPNPFASALRSQRSGAIGIVVRDINDPFLRQIIRDVQKESHQKGIEVLIGHAEYAPEIAERQLNLMINYWFDGLILLGNLPGDEKLIHELNVKDTPMVAVASGFDMNLPSVDFDNAYGSKLAMEYLFSKGHKDIAFIGNTELAGVKQRLNVYEKMLKQANLYRKNYVYSFTKSRREAIEYTRQLLGMEKPPTAIFCPQDYLALASMSGIWQMGLSVPKDVSVFGYDDIEEAEDAFIPLSTIRQSTDVAAKNAVDLLLDIMNDVKIAKKKIKIKPEICIRNSCR